MSYRVIASLTVCTVISMQSHADPDDVLAAETSVEQFLNYAGSVDKIEEKLTRPLLSEGSMVSPDGTTFDAQLTCESEDAFMEVFIVPSATGDVGSIYIQQDTMMDGLYDYVFTSPTHASGLCGNGIISCSPGTWDDCQGYRWQANSLNQLELIETNVTNLGGCYCINNNCGAGLLVNNIEGAVSTVASGAAGALSARHPYYAITNTRINGPTAEYFGQDVSACDAVGTLASSGYYSNSTNIQSDGSAEASTNDTYALLNATPSSTSGDISSVKCDERRSVNMSEVDLNDIIDFNGGSGEVSSCGPECLQMTLGLVGDDYWGPSVCEMFTHNAKFTVLKPANVISAVLSDAIWDDWIQVRVNGAQIWSGPYEWLGMGNPPGACELSTSWNTQPNVDFTSILQAGGTMDFNIRVAVAGGGEGFAYAKVLVDSECTLLPDVMTQGCQAYEADPQCTLTDEMVDGVSTITGGISTGLIPVASTKTISGVSCSEDVTRDWWHREKTYSCMNTATIPDFSAELDRIAFIQSSATDTTYQDIQTDPITGASTITNGTMTLLDELPVPACVQTCKTSRTRPRTDVGRSGPVSDQNVESTSNEFLYHQCSKDNVCPMGSDETLIVDCGCINEFAEASSIMQIIRMGGQDVICSSGIPQTLP